MAADAVLRLWDAIVAAPSDVPTRAVFLVGAEGTGRSYELAEIARRLSDRARVVSVRWMVAGDYLAPLLDLVDARLWRGRLISRKLHDILRHASNILTATPYVKDWYKVLFHLRVQAMLSNRTPIDTALSDDSFWHAYRQRWADLGRDKPLVALLDDVERLDAVGARAWRFLGRMIEGLVDRPALVVLAYAAHDEAAERRLRAQTGAHFAPQRCQMLPLAPLDHTAARTVARDLLRIHPAAGSEKCLDAIVDLARGNRRLLHGATEAVRESGSSESDWLAALERLARHDLANLPPRERRLCELLAAVGGRVDERVLTTDAFHRYWNVGVREIDDVLPPAVAHVTYPAARVAVLERVPEPVRHADLKAYAAALREAHDQTGDPALLDEAARWFGEAGDAEERTRMLVEAARAYAAVDRAAEALDRFRMVRGADTDEMPAPVRARLLLEEADAAFRAGDTARSWEVLAAAEEAAKSLPPQASAAASGAVHLARGTLRAHGSNADRRAALADFDAALAAGVPALEARARCEKAFCLASFDPRGAEAEARAGVAAARVCASRADELFGLHLLGEVLARAGTAGEEAERCLREVADADDASSRLRSHALDSLANHYARIGRYAESVERFHASIALKSELGDRDGLARSYGGLARLHHRRGEFEKAAVYYDLDLDLIAEGTPDDAGAFVQCNNLRADVARLAGDHAEAHRRLDSSFARLPEIIGDARTVPDAYTRLMRGRLLLDERRADEAEADVEAAAVGLATMPAVAAEVDVARSRIALARGRPADARTLLGRARTSATEPYALFEVERRAAEAAAAVGDYTEATRARDRARAAAGALGNRWMLEQLEIDSARLDRQRQLS